MFLLIDEKPGVAAVDVERESGIWRGAGLTETKKPIERRGVQARSKSVSKTLSLTGKEIP